MDRRFKPMTPSEQITARVELYAQLAEVPLPPRTAIKLIVKKLRLTVPDLANLTGVSERFLRDTLSGKGNPSLLTVEKVLAPFGLTISVTKPHKNKD